MKRIRKKRGNSSFTEQGDRKGRKGGSSAKDRSPSRNRSIIKRGGKSKGKKKSLLSRSAVIRQRQQKISRGRLTKRSPGERARKRSLRKTSSSSRALRSSAKKQTSKRVASKKVIRVLGHGQFSVNSETLRKLNKIDDSIVHGLEKEDLTDEKFKEKIEELEELVTKRGKLLDPKAITSSDIILPGSDLTIDEASKIFRGEGVIPGLD